MAVRYMYSLFGFVYALLGSFAFEDFSEVVMTGVQMRRDRL